MKIIDSLLKLILLIILVAGIAYMGACVYGNFISPIGQTGKVVDPPETKYLVIIEATNKPLYTDDLSVGQDSIYVLNGYWEFQKDSFIFRDIKLSIDEHYFGKITVIKRGR